MKKKEVKATELIIDFVKTFSDTVREPMLFLDSDLRVIAANRSFYNNFKVSKEETEGVLIYKLGNNQWDIPKLRELLENILPEKSVFNDYEVTHTFPEIGMRVMLLNARQLADTKQILLAIEDITLERSIQNNLLEYTKELEKGEVAKSAELNLRISELNKFTKLMVGRELKMVELKKEVKELKEEIIDEKSK